MKSFNHCPLETPIPLIKQINGPAGRFYETPEGKHYPSVTTVLGQFEGDTTWLDSWRKNIGEERADEILREAGRRGTAVHDLAERYLNNQKDWAKGRMPLHTMPFRKIIPLLERIDNIVMQETRMWSHILRVAGTVDCIAEFDGVLSVIDFKTSRSTRDPAKYFLQESAYALMFEELTGRKIGQLVTIVSDDNSPTPHLYVDDKKKWLVEFIKQRKKLPDWTTFSA